MDKADEDYTKKLKFHNEDTQETLIFEFNTLQSVYRSPQIYSKDLTFLIVDEVHHGAGFRFNEAIRLPCKYKMGLSATIEGNEKNRILEKSLGPKVFTFSLREAKNYNIIPDFKVHIHKTFLDIQEQDEFENLSKLIRNSLVTVNQERESEGKPVFENLYEFIQELTRKRYKGEQIEKNWVILQGLISKRRSVIHNSSPKIEDAIELINELGQRKKCIVFCMDIATTNYIHSQVSHTIKNSFILHSQLDKQAREISLKLFKNSVTGVLIAPKMLDEGIDIPDADVGINVASSKTKLQLVQRMGRILRKKEGKSPVFYHFVALPLKEHFLDEEDALTYLNDLAWVQDIILKMGLEYTTSESMKEHISELERRSETFVHNYFLKYKKIPGRDYGSLKIETIVSAVAEFKDELIKELQKLSFPISDDQWITALRHCQKENKEVSIPQFKLLLILSNRDPKQIKIHLDQIKDDPPDFFNPIPIKPQPLKRRVQNPVRNKLDCKYDFSGSEPHIIIEDNLKISVNQIKTIKDNFPKIVSFSDFHKNNNGISQLEYEKIGGSINHLNIQWVQDSENRYSPVLLLPEGCRVNLLVAKSIRKYFQILVKFYERYKDVHLK